MSDWSIESTGAILERLDKIEQRLSILEDQWRRRNQSMINSEKTTVSNPVGRPCERCGQWVNNPHYVEEWSQSTATSNLVGRCYCQNCHY